MRPPALAPQLKRDPPGGAVTPTFSMGRISDDPTSFAPLDSLVAGPPGVQQYLSTNHRTCRCTTASSSGTRWPTCRHQNPNHGISGVPITLAFYTVGGGCTRTGPTSASVDGLVAVIQPFDSVVTELPPNWGCPMDLRGLEHTATVRFASAGTATVQVLGRRQPGDSALIIERTVVIQ